VARERTDSIAFWEASSQRREGLLCSVHAAAVKGGYDDLLLHEQTWQDRGVGCRTGVRRHGKGTGTKLR